MNKVTIDSNHPSTDTVPVIDATLDQVFELSFTKRDLIVIFNTLVEKDWKLGAARLVIPLVEKIEPMVINKETQQ